MRAPHLLTLAPQAGRALLAGLVALTLLVPLALCDDAGAAMPPVQRGGPSLLPRAGGSLVFTSATKSEPVPPQSVEVSGRSALDLCIVDVTHVAWAVLPRTSLPTDYRMAYLLPVFNSKYKRHPLTRLYL